MNHNSITTCNKLLTYSLFFAIIHGMKTTQTEPFQPESVVVLRDGQLDMEYYDQVYEDKRKAALREVREDLINQLCGVPARMGRAVVYLMQHVAEQAN